MRPFILESATLEYHKNSKRFLSTGQINIKNKEDWYKASDLRAFANWVSDSTQEDYLTT
jgi:hypothetical protein